MASLNKVMLIGNLGKDPEVKYTPSGLQIAKFTVATTDSVKKDDSWENKTEWHNIVSFGKSAEFVGKHLKKGATVYLEGRIQTSSWDDDNGVKKYKTEIIADSVKSLIKKEASDQSASQQPEQANDLPF